LRRECIKKGKGHVEETINSAKFGIKIFALFKP
jgi:hypothetical protein